MELEIDTPEDLECLFNWKPEIDDDFELCQAVKRTENTEIEKPDGELRFAAVNRLIKLAYLHSHPKLETRDCELARQYLDKAKEINEQILQERQQQQQQPVQFKLASRFAVGAFELRFRMLVDQLTESDVQDEMNNLRRLWQDKNERANTYGMKSDMLVHFIPIRYDDAMEALKQALQLQPDHANWHFGVASLLTKRWKHRGSRVEESPFEEMEAAVQRMEAAGQSKPLMYALYAETLLKTEHNGRCHELMETAFSKLEEVPDLRSECVAINISMKVYKHLRMFENFRAALERGMKNEKCLQNSNFCLKVCIDFERRQNQGKAKEWLDKAVAVCEKEAGHHIWVSLQYIKTYSSEKGDTWAMQEFEKLLRAQQFQNNSNDRANILLWRSKFHIQKERPDIAAAMMDLVEALDCDRRTVENDYISCKAVKQYLTENRQGNEKYLAWYLANINPNNDTRKQALNQFSMALTRDRNDEFALEHSGRCYMECKRYDSAVARFKMLPDSNRSKAELLAEAQRMLSAR